MSLPTTFHLVADQYPSSWTTTSAATASPRCTTVPPAVPPVPTVPEVLPPLPPPSIPAPASPKASSARPAYTAYHVGGYFYQSADFIEPVSDSVSRERSRRRRSRRRDAHRRRSRSRSHRRRPLAPALASDRRDAVPKNPPAVKATPACRPSGLTHGR